MVTNASQSTSILSYYEAAEKWSLPPSANLLERLKSVAVLAAEALTWHYPNKRIFGIDIGITEEGTIYIVEINRKPLLKGFSENQQRKVRKYQRNKANKRRK
ncbi:YheC/YheD family protein [Thalassobacillus sp. C254]|uniref:YheC/YheD family protein n=1 Tax=Thalassobacillus sp. C254 TaxID=1225341 RepID=UPI0006D1CEBD|nr:YheC/YheD family protein [Thalassobacillus sp. C254]